MYLIKMQHRCIGYSANFAPDNAVAMSLQVIRRFSPFICAALALALLVNLSSGAIAIGNYILNKDYIAKVLCVNKDRPEMSCEGKCHLMKQLEADDDQGPKATNEPAETVFLPMFAQTLRAVQWPAIGLLSSELACDDGHWLSSGHLSSVFRPPQG